MSRSVPEWIAAHDDQAIPPRVRLRVFERYGGVCQLSQRKIMAGDKWQADHIKALWLGGEHREGNLWPVLVEPHKQKSSAEQTIQAKCDRVRKKHLGIFPSSKAKMKSRGFQKTRQP
jgi:5-methylcytosine-specific restriction protein A